MQHYLEILKLFQMVALFLMVLERALYSPLTQVETIFTFRYSIHNGVGTAEVFPQYDQNGNVIGTYAGGGAIACNSLSTVDIDNVVFSDNLGDFGGAVSIFGGCTANITNSTFDSNHATHSGGAVYGFYSTVIVDSSIFTNNSADLVQGKGRCHINRC